VQRPATRLHEELCWPNVQVRVPDVHEIVWEEIVKPHPARLDAAICELMAMIVAVAIGAIWFESYPVAAEPSKKLSGSQIRAKFAGMQLTDEVHWSYVYDRNGRLRSYSMGTKKFGQWTVEKDALCLYLNEPDDGCYEVSLWHGRIEMKPSGLGLSVEGILQTPSDRN
jgi:hypothetical protein